MLIALLIISILSLSFVLIGFRGINDRIDNLAIELDAIKEKTDKLGTNTYE